MAFSDDDPAYAPFGLTLEPSVFFTGAGRGAALDQLFESVDQGAPVCLVTGANGAGKSALVAQLARRFEHIAEVLYLPQPRLPMMELVSALSEQIGIDRAGLGDDEHAERALLETLQRRRALGRRTVLVVEEAQAAASATLRSLQRMCQSGGDDPWLQLLVFADADAEATEALPRVLTPVSLHIELPAPDVDAVQAYCNQHLQIAGWDEADWIDRTAAAELHSLANGSFRRLNLIAGAAVEAAASDGERVLDAKAMRTAVRQLGIISAPRAFSESITFHCRERMAPFVVAARRLVPSVRVAVPFACGVCAVVLLMSARGLLQSDSVTEEHAVAQSVAPVAALIAEPRMVPSATSGPETVAAVQLPAVMSPQAEPGRRDVEPVPSRSLGDPRVALLGSAIAELANRVSDAGNGAFALRTAGETATALRLVQRVDTDRFALGTRKLQRPPVAATARHALPSNPAEALDDWFLHSTSWLGERTPEHYSIQLLLVSRDTDKLHDFLDQMPEAVDRDALRAFPTQRDGRALTLVVFGDYPNAEAARNAISSLPRSLRRLQPFVRSLGSLRAVVESV